MKEMLKELDARYVKKSELKQEVVDIVEDRFMTKEDYHEILGKMNAMEIELAKNTKLLMGIFESSEETKHLQIVQKTETKHIQSEVAQMKKKPYKRMWQSLPAIVQFFIITVSLFSIYFLYSIIIGREATDFMNRNGLPVALGSLIATASTMYFTRNTKKNDKEE